MSMRYAICLSYNGAAFSGWQVQPNAPSVQETLESAISTLLKCPVAVTGAGRTDASVNARGYIAHFELPSEAGQIAADFCCKLNAILPREVVVHSIKEAGAEFHARFDARRREYTYFIHRKKDPFADPWSWKCTYPGLDFEAMSRACNFLLGTHDFSCFEKTGGNSKTSICTIFEARWEPYIPTHIAVMPIESPVHSKELIPTPLRDNSWPYWYFRVAADRFLRNMVRAIVGTMIEVGRGKRTPESIATLITSGTRSDAGESVPGHALFLSKVEYKR